MKLTALAFLVVLAAAHLAGDLDPVLSRPLSMFRDGPAAWLGYLLFSLLLLLLALYATRLWRRGHEPEAIISGFAGALLVLVAATPSANAFHECFALQLFLLLYAYYGVLLYRTELICFVFHLVAPLALAMLTNFHSYGLWQKCYIVYFVLASTAHDHLLGWLIGKPASKPAARSARGQIGRRRKVYQLDPGRTWSRRQTSSSSVV